MPTIEVSDETLEKIKDQLGSDYQVESIENMDDLVGNKLAFQCARYIYYGKIEAVNSTYIELSEAQTVFNTGEFSAKEPGDSQDMPKKKLYIMRQSIESFYPVRW